jgi:cytochrome c oxidase cbb3-type subunit 3
MAPVVESADTAEAAGRRLFLTHCASCHGADGEGARGPTLAVPRLTRAPDLPSLSETIRHGIEGTLMPGTRLEADEVRQLATFVLGLGRGKTVETVSGDVTRGEHVYRTKGGCTECHTIKGQGGAVGPDLTDIGRQRAPAYLRTSLLDPSAEVPRSFSSYRWDGLLAQNFLMVRLVTNDGRHLMGVRVNEDTFSIQVRDLEGRLHSFFKSELASLDKQWGVSPMPAYGEVLTKEELDDLVAYLASLRDK